jgi:hypothetical protein
MMPELQEPFTDNVIPLGTRLPRERARTHIILTHAALDMKQVANATRGAEGMLPMAVAQVLEALASEDIAGVTEAVRGWLFELRASRGEGLR